MAFLSVALCCYHCDRNRRFFPTTSSTTEASDTEPEAQQQEHDHEQRQKQRQRQKQKQKQRQKRRQRQKRKQHNEASGNRQPSSSRPSDATSSPPEMYGDVSKMGMGARGAGAGAAAAADQEPRPLLEAVPSFSSPAPLPASASASASDSLNAPVSQQTFKAATTRAIRQLSRSFDCYHNWADSVLKVPVELAAAPLQLQDPTTERNSAQQQMPQEESKQVDPATAAGEHEAPAQARADDKAKQAAVESDGGSGHSDDDDDDDNENNDNGGAPEGTAASSSVAAAGAKKKKRSKRKKLKEVLTGKGDSSADKKKSAIDSLTPQQIEHFVEMNPALAQELAAQRGSAGPGGASNHQETLEMLKKLSLQDIMTGLASSGKNVKDMASYTFWQTQPVQSFDEVSSSAPIKEGPIKIQKVEDVPTEPPALLTGFKWATVDVTDAAQMKELYELLNGHYVEDDEAMFRFNYGTAILKWAMCSPGWKKGWHVGVRASQSGKLVAFISAIPMKLRVRDNVIDASEVNFLCIHKKLRSKRLAPVLIKEITRLCNLDGVWQAIYTGGIVLPTPVSTCRYFHRALNWQKLYDVGFSPLPTNSKPLYQVRKYTLPEQTSTPRLREMQTKDVAAVHDLLKRYMKRWDLVPEWTAEEAEHWLLPQKGEDKVVWSYVVEDESKKITDFFSFYALESTVINNAKHKVIRAAYLYYYATETGLTTPVDKPALKTRLNQLMYDALILAKRYQFDVFNALSMMDNALFLEQQKFGPGDGQLHFYLFNYRANPISGGVNKKNILDENMLSGIGLPML